MKTASLRLCVGASFLLASSLIGAGCGSSGDSKGDSKKDGAAGAGGQGGGSAGTGGAAGAAGMDGGVATDGPAADRAATDGLAADRAATDGPTADRPAADGPRPVSDAAAPGSAEEFCLAVYREYLDLGQTCIGYSPDWLASFLNPAGNCRAVTKGIAAGRLRYSAGDAARCLAAFRGLTCADLENSDMGSADCDNAFVGQVATNGACYNNGLNSSFFAECGKSDFCAGAAPGGRSCPGTCKAFKKAGEACPAGDKCDTSSSCSPGGVCVADALESGACGGPTGGTCKTSDLYCTGNRTTAGTCAKRKTSGACATEGECAARYECKGLMGTTPGVCSALKNIGDACTPGVKDCAFYVGYCNAGTSTCAAYPTTVGADCGYIAMEIVGCLRDTYCDSVIPAGKCRAAKAIGDTCDPRVQNMCGLDGECDRVTLKCAAICRVP